MRNKTITIEPEKWKWLKVNKPTLYYLQKKIKEEKLLRLIIRVR